jgi:signal transduction histidine kinase/CheY-like chemotaxis protein
MEKAVQRHAATGQVLPLDSVLLKELASLIDEAPELIPCTNACFHLLSSNRRRIICQAVSQGYRATQLAYGLDINESRGVIIALKSRDAVPVSDATKSDLVARVASERYGLRAALYVPVIVNDEAVGVLVFSYKHVHEWSQQQIFQAKEVALACARLLQKSTTIAVQHTVLTANERRQEVLLDTVPGAVIAVDRDFLTYAANAHVVTPDSGNGERMALQRATIAHLIDDAVRGPELRQAIQDICAGDIATFEAMVENQNNLWLVRMRPIPGDSGIEGAAIACIDMSEVLQAKGVIDAARHLEALGLIAANVAHEFNNVLQIFSGTLEKISEDTPGHEPQEQIHAARQAIERGAKLARQLLTFSRTRPPQTQLVDPVVLLSEWWALLETTVGRSHPLELTMRGSAQVNLDPDQFQLALINLCMNASYASREGEGITIQVQRVQRSGATYVSTAVIDRGYGMTPEVLKRATEPFFTTRPRGVGTGLGLSAARTVAENHGGFLHIESEVGVGTTVALCLPVYPLHQVQIRTIGSPEIHTPTTVEAKRGNIFIVEDEVEVRGWLERLLNRRGYHTRQASSVAEALALFKEQPSWPDVILLDMTLSDGSGSEVYSFVQTLRPGLPIIICSGYADTIEVQRILSGGHSMLSKPFTSRQVEDALAQLIRPA